MRSTDDFLNSSSKVYRNEEKKMHLQFTQFPQAPALDLEGNLMLFFLGGSYFGDWFHYVVCLLS